MSAGLLQDYLARDATDLAALVRTRQVSPTEWLEAARERLAAVEPHLGAVPRVFAPSAPPRGGALAGVPFLLKDLFTDLAGTVSENGSDFHDPRPAATNATVVDRYLAAGLVIFGKTHSPEFGGTSTSESRRFGVTRNPYDPTRSAGGSSGGSAAAVAAGIAPAAQATDAGGSIIIPAACCGVFGFKPTPGLVPLGPKRVEGAGGLASQHVVSRTVRDSAALLDVAAASSSFVSALERPPRRLRIALLDMSIEGLQPAPECRAALAAAAALCERLGHVVEPADLQAACPPPGAAERSLRLASVARTVLDLEAQIGRKACERDLEPATWARYQAGLRVTGPEVLLAREAMLASRESMRGFMTRWDVLLSPAMACLPPKLGAVSLDRLDTQAEEENRRCTTFARLYNWTGQPCLSAPLGLSPQGLPIGLLFAGRPGEDAGLLQLAAELEAAQPWPRVVNPTPGQEGAR